jgi:hypothetical protein
LSRVQPEGTMVTQRLLRRLMVLVRTSFISILGAVVF